MSLVNALGSSSDLNAMNMPATDKGNSQKKTMKEMFSQLLQDKEMPLTEFTTATYPSGEKDVPDDVYYTFYTRDGIYCRKQGESELEWQLPFADSSQYEKVMSYLQTLDSQSNLRFACHENFWRDFLNDGIDMDKFNNFLETRVNNGVPNYLNVHKTGVNIDKQSAQYSKYMNQPDFVKKICYSAEEAFRTLFGMEMYPQNTQFSADAFSSRSYLNRIVHNHYMQQLLAEEDLFNYNA